MTGAVLPRLVLIGAAAVGVWALLGLFAARERRELEHKHVRAMAERRRDFARRTADQTVAAYQRDQEAQRLRQRELETALGGPIAAAAKNPELSIGQAIEQVAQRCAPKATRVLVRVDRFTEFDCFLQLPRQLAASELAVLARCVLEHTGQYVNRLQFGFRGNVFAELGRAEVELVASGNADMTVVESWLKEMKGEAPPAGIGSPGIAANTESSETGNVSPAQKLHRDVGEAFNASYQKAHEQFAAAIKLLEDSVDLKDLGSFQQFQERQRILDEAEKRAGAARVMLQNPASEYTRMLQTAGADSIYIQAASRTMATKFAGAQSAVASAFRAFEGRLKSSRAYLEMLAKYFGSWSYLPAQQTMEFENSSVQGAHAQARDRLQGDAQILESAIREWSAAQQRIGERQ